MSLSTYSREDLAVLLMAVNMGKTAAMEYDSPWRFNKLDDWALRIKKAMAEGNENQNGIKTKNEPICGS